MAFKHARASAWACRPDNLPPLLNKNYSTVARSPSPMRVLVNNLIDGTSTNIPIPRGMNPVRIGLDERNAVVLRSHYVPSEAAALANNGNGWEFWSLCQSRWSL